jgi:hypothetical protein
VGEIGSVSTHFLHVRRPKVGSGSPRKIGYRWHVTRAASASMTRGVVDPTTRGAEPCLSRRILNLHPLPPLQGGSAAAFYPPPAPKDLVNALIESVVCAWAEDWGAAGSRMRRLICAPDAP